MLAILLGTPFVAKIHQGAKTMILIHIDMTASCSYCRFVSCTFMKQISCSTTSQRCFLRLRVVDYGGRWSWMNSLWCSKQLEMIWALLLWALSSWKKSSEEGYVMLIKNMVSNSTLCLCWLDNVHLVPRNYLQYTTTNFNCWCETRWIQTLIFTPNSDPTI